MAAGLQGPGQLLLLDAGRGFRRSLGSGVLGRRRRLLLYCRLDRGSRYGFLAFLWRQYHDQLPPFHLGVLLHRAVLREISLHPLDQPHPQFLVGHLASAVAQRDLGLVALLQKTGQVPQLDLVVALVGSRPELDLFDDDLLLLELGLVPLLGLAILVFPVIHDAADGRRRRRCNLDEIELGFLRELVRRSQAHDADLFAAGPYQPDFRRVDLAVDPRFLFLCDVEPPRSGYSRAARPSRASSARSLETKSARLIWPRSSPLRVRTAIF